MFLFLKRTCGAYTAALRLEFFFCYVGGRSENAGKFLSSPNGLFRFLPTFYPKKTSNLTEVAGEDKKTLTIFSSLTIIL